MDGLLKDMRFGLRLLIKSPGVTLAAIASLALGIGANTAIYTVVQSVFFPPLDVAEADRLVSLYTLDESNPGYLAVSYPNLEDYREQHGGFERLVAYQFAPLSYRTPGGEGEPIFGLLVSGDYFDTLGVTAQLGRTFLPEEDRVPGSHPVAVVSHGFWQRRVGGDPDVVGSTVVVNRVPLTVIGVAPPGFHGIDVGLQPEIWTPMMMYERLSGQPQWIENRRGLNNFAVGRLAPDVTLDQAQQAADAISARLAEAYPDDNAGRRVELVPTAQARLNPNVRDGFAQALGFMTVIVGLVLLIACANVANLMLARATGRQREVAVRLALGAGRMRLVRQLLTESVLLALLGGAFGLLVADWTTGALASAIPQTPIPVALSFDIDLRVLLVTLVIALGTGVLFGLAPAARAVRADVVGSLRSDAQASAGADRRFGLRNVLVIAQVAVSLVLLVGAGMFIRSMQSAQQIDPGFEVHDSLVLTLNLDLEGYEADDGRTFLREVTTRIGGLSGVHSATVSQVLPLSLFGGLSRTVFVEGQAATDEEEGTLVTVNAVGLGYFDSLGIGIRSGRDFDATDGQDGRRVAIVNEVMAADFWPGDDPVGQRFFFHGQADRPITVLGISGYAKVATLGEDPTPMVYMPIEQEYGGGVFLHVRTDSDPEPLIEPVRRAIRSLDPELPVFGITTLESQVDASMFPTRVGAAMLGVFGALGLALAAIGLYGVIAYSVSRRTREIGIRMALGAEGGTVLAMVLRQGMLLVGVGLLVGLALSQMMTRQITGLLYGVGASDLLAYGSMTGILLLVAAVASLVPARRATRVDPVRALRFD